MASNFINISKRTVIHALDVHRAAHHSAASFRHVSAPEFMRCVGLKFMASGDDHWVFEIINQRLYLLAKIKYGI